VDTGQNYSRFWEDMYRPVIGDPEGEYCRFAICCFASTPERVKIEAEFRTFSAPFFIAVKFSEG